MRNVCYENNIFAEFHAVLFKLNLLYLNDYLTLNELDEFHSVYAEL